MSVVDTMIESAVGNHKAGRTQRAEELYKRILVHDPRNVRVLHNLSVICHQGSKTEQAIEGLREAMDADTSIAQLNNTTAAR